MTLFSFIKSRVSIVEVASHYVTLKQAGTYWKGTCPFHSETDASFTISPDKGIFYCFGCHASGDAIAFIAKKENLSQIEAAWHLVELCHLKVPDDLIHEASSNSIESLSEKQAYHNLCKSFAHWAHKQLLSSQSALTYLEGRCISREMIERFELGYIPGGLRAMNTLVSDLSKEHILLKDLLQVGIVIQTGVSIYSPFEERILFPIHDHLGKYCGFGGRIYRSHDERAKYYNSKDLPFFQKGHILFGIDLAKQAMKDANFAFLVEGYTDCIALYQAGYHNVVATLGTACTQDHLHLIGRYVSTVYVLYDGDRAGQQAVLRLAELCFDANLELKIMQLPFKEDPASFLQKKGDLNELKMQAREFFDFFVQTHGTLFATKSLADKLAVSEKIVEIISKINDPFKQDLIIQKACSTLGVPFSSFKDHCLKKKAASVAVGATHHEEPLPSHAPLGDDEGIAALEKKIICAIIDKASESALLLLDEGFLPYFSKHAQSLIEKYREIAAKYKPNEWFSVFYDSLSEHDRMWLSGVSLSKDFDSSLSMLEYYLKLFRKQTWKVVVQDMKKQMLEAQIKGDKALLQSLSEKFLKLKHDMKNWGLI